MLDADESVRQLEAAIRRAKEYKPPLAGVLEAFSGLLTARRAVKHSLLQEAMVAPKPDMERLAAGVPALADIEVGKWFSQVDQGFLSMLSTLEASFSTMERELSALRQVVEERPELPAAWLAAIIAGDEGLFKGIADELAIDPQAARFIVEQGTKPFFEAAGSLMAPHVDAMRWDRGYCPVCGAFPDATYLKKGKEEYEYLVAHGGQRWLHCSLCAHEWRFRRMVCPYCENEDADSLEYYQADAMEHERIYVCHKCRRYVTCLDVSQLVDAPPGELLPFELLHMDVIAQQKGYEPMAWSFVSTGLHK